MSKGRKIVCFYDESSVTPDTWKHISEGHEGGLDADTVDGKHASELGGGGGMEEHGNEWHEPDMELKSDADTHKANASAHHAKTTSVTELTDHTKAVHDALGIDAATLEGSTKAQVQDHDPKAHTHPLSEVTGHDKNAHDALAIDAGSVDGKEPGTTEGKLAVLDANARVQDSAKLEGLTKVQVQDHPPQAHTLASHSTKAHSELTNIGENDHHTKFTITEHDVTERHPLGTVVPHDALASLSEKSHASLTGVTGDQHHARQHDHSLAADGSPIAVAGVPNLDAGKITTGTFDLARIPTPLTGKDADTVDGAHAGLAANNVFKILAAIASGDIFYVDATPQVARLAKAADGKFLKLVSGLPSWQDPPAGADHNILSATHPDSLADSVAAGDILFGNATPKWARLPKGSDGQVLTLVSGLPAWQTPGGGGDLSVFRFRKVGQYVTTGIAATAKTTLALTANRLYAIPFFVPKTITLDRIAIHVSTAGTGNARLGIYRDDGTADPSTATLILDAGEVSIAATGKQELTINQTLTGGYLYYLAIVTNGTPTIGAVALASMMTSFFGLTDITTTAWLTFAYRSFTYAALPNPFNGTITLASGACPAVFVRLSA